MLVEARVQSVIFERNEGRRLFHRAELIVISGAEPETALSLQLIHPLDVPPEQVDRLRLLRPGDRGRFRLRETAEPGRYAFADQSDPAAFELLERGEGAFPGPMPMVLRPDERAADIAARGRLFLGLDLSLGGLTFIIAMVTAVLLGRRASDRDKAG